MKSQVVCAALVLVWWHAAASQPEMADLSRPIEWDMPRLRFADAVHYFSKAASAEVAQEDFGCMNAPVGPIKGTMTPDEFWQRLTESVGAHPRMLGTKEEPIYSSQRPPVPGLPPEKVDYDLPRDKLHENIRRIAEITRNKTGRALLISYLGSHAEDDDILVGPLRAFVTPQEVLLRLIDPIPALTVRHVDNDMVSVEPRTKIPRKNDLRRILCKPNRTLPPSDSVLVEGSRLPPLEGDSVIVLDRQRIDQAGAVSIPDLLRYISQSSFHYGSGHRSSGAQFAELRGLGAEFTLVLINGRRAMGSASEPAVSAFDLSLIPMTAVERIEISPDAMSLIHGPDAIGGIVNIVLKERSEPGLDVRYGGLRGGGEQVLTALSVGDQNEHGHYAIIGDLFQSRELLGRERDRWNNQDYRRFGGGDFRSRMSTPSNVRTLDGSNLPGLDSPFATLSIDGSSIDAQAGNVSLTSLRAYQAIVPDRMRASIAINGRWNVGSATVSTDVLGIKKENDLQLLPNTIPGYVWGADHPENPFGVPVTLEAALTRWPALRRRHESTLLRGAVAIDGPVGTWNYSAFLARSDDYDKAWYRNTIDSSAIQSGLLANSPAVSVIGLARGEAAPAVTDSAVTRSYAGATHLAAMVRGSLFELAGDKIVATLGIEQRHETIQWGDEVARSNRDISAAFSQITIPLASDSLRLPLLQEARLTLGARLDDYSDSQSVISERHSFEWKMFPTIKAHATISDSFRPPSMLDMHFAQQNLPAQVFDLKRGEIAPVVVKVGGNPDLKPTIGHSRIFGISYDSGKDVLMTAAYWRTRMRDRVAGLPMHRLLAAENASLSQRVVRSPPTPEDQAAGRPGRLMTMDITRANVGVADIEGFDLSGEATIKTQLGVFEPRLIVTVTNRFKYGDLPTTYEPVRDRAGIASELGTIPTEKGIASLAFVREGWRIHLHARALSSYKDWDADTRTLTGRTVSPSTQWDMNISKDFPNLSVTLGVMNLTNREPPLSGVSSLSSVGFDLSQGDLRGRELYLAVTGTF